MTVTREEVARALAQLRDNAYFLHYVKMLQVKRDASVQQLLYSDHPDEALRGAARMYDEHLNIVLRDSGITL